MKVATVTETIQISEVMLLRLLVELTYTTSTVTIPTVRGADRARCESTRSRRVGHVKFRSLFPLFLKLAKGVGRLNNFPRGVPSTITRESLIKQSVVLQRFNKSKGDVIYRCLKHETILKRSYCTIHCNLHQ